MTLHLTSQGFAQLSPHVTFPPTTCEVSTEQSQGSQIWGGELFFFFQTSFNAGGPSCLLERVAPCRVAVLPGWEAEPLAETQAGTSEARRLWRVCARRTCSTGHRTGMNIHKRGTWTCVTGKHACYVGPIFTLGWRHHIRMHYE